MSNYHYKFSNGLSLYKWPHKTLPTEETMKAELQNFGFMAYDLQTCPPWFERSSHSHDYQEIRAAVSGAITFHFEDLPITVEAGDIIIIPPGVPHTVMSHNGNPFTAFKGSHSGERKVTEYSDAKGSVEYLEKIKNAK